MPTRAVGGACSWGERVVVSAAVAVAAAVSRGSGGSASSELSLSLPSSSQTSASEVTVSRGRRRLRRRPRRRPRRTGLVVSERAGAASSPPPPLPPPLPVLPAAPGNDAPAAASGDGPCCSPLPSPLTPLAPSPEGATAVVTTPQPVPPLAGGAGNNRAGTPTGRPPSKLPPSWRPPAPTCQRQIRRPAALPWSVAPSAAAAGPLGAGTNASVGRRTMAVTTRVAAAAAAAAAADDDVVGGGGGRWGKAGAPAAMAAPRVGMVTLPKQLTTAPNGRRKGEAEGEAEGGEQSEAEDAKKGEGMAGPRGVEGGGCVAKSTHVPHAATTRLPCRKPAVGGITAAHSDAPARSHHHHRRGSVGRSAEQGATVEAVQRHGDGGASVVQSRCEQRRVSLGTGLGVNMHSPRGPCPKIE